MTELHEEIQKYFRKKFGIAAERIMEDVAHEWEEIDLNLQIADRFYEIAPGVWKQFKKEIKENE